MQRLAQALLDRADDEAAHEARIAKAHLGLGRVHVDVDLARFAFDEEGDDRVPVGGQEIEVGPAQRAGERLVAHGAAVDEDELLARVRTAIGRQADPAQELDAVAARIEFERICGEVVAQRLAQPLGAARFARAASRPVKARADVAREREARLGRGHRQPLDDVGYGYRLGPVGFQELEPRRRRGEEIARLDPRARRCGAGLDRALDPVLDDDLQGRRRAAHAGADLEPRHGGDRGQRLAAEAEGRDGHEIAVGDFRRRVPLDAEGEIGFVHAAPVVGDADEPAPARLDRDLDPFRPGVERVLDQFLHRRGRPLDHFARGDAVDEQGIETANRHGAKDLAEIIALAGERGKR